MKDQREQLILLLDYFIDGLSNIIAGSDSDDEGRAGDIETVERLKSCKAWLLSPQQQALPQLEANKRLAELRAYFAAKDKRHQPHSTEYHCKKWDIERMLYGKPKGNEGT